MNIILFTNQLNTGGAERQLCNLALGLIQANHQVKVLTLLPGGQYWDWLKGKGCPVEAIFQGPDSIAALNKFVRLFTIIYKVRQKIKAEKPEILYSFMYQANVFSFFSGVCNRQTKVVWGLRDNGAMMLKKERPYIYISRFLSRWIPLTIINSHSGREQQKKFFHGPMKIVFNGTDIDQARKMSAVHPVLSSLKSQGYKIVGMVGRLSPMKDFECFIKAAEQLVSKNKNIRIICIAYGNEEYKRTLVQLTEIYQIDQYFTWLGEQEDMASLYNGFDLLCSSSKSEGFSNVICESMLIGTPCVVTDVGDAKKILGKDKWVVPARSPTLLANKMLEYFNLGESDVIELSNYCQKRIATCFSVDTMVNKTVQVISGLA